MPARNIPRIAIFVSFSGQGGVERMLTNLAGGLVDAGFAVDMVLAKTQGEHIAAIPKAARIVALNAKHTFSSLPGLVGYLRREQPVAMLAAKDRAIKVAVIARRMAGVSTRLVGRLGTTVSAALEGRSWLSKQLWFAGMRLFYGKLDRIVAVSQGVADDIEQITRLPKERITVIRNPVITSGLTSLARETVEHPWFQEPEIPIIIGVGRLTRQKDFPTLVRAFAELRAERPCRLIILGDGRARSHLETLAAELGVASDIALPGFARNPYAYLARASVFVLSSAWEGSPNALTEALALGVPSVSTDCPSGPREILQGGRVGALVPVGDAGRMAEAIRATLDRAPAAEELRGAVRDYSVERSALHYLGVLGLRPL